MDKYIISSSTLAIISLSDGTSEVYDESFRRVINKSAFDIVCESCKFYGSSYEGRCEGTEYLIGIKYKCPIVVSEKHEIIIFPTKSSRNKDCSWINYNKIITYYSIPGPYVKINFISGGFIDIKISNFVFTNQLFKASRLDSILKSKKH